MLSRATGTVRLCCDDCDVRSGSAGTIPVCCFSVGSLIYVMFPPTAALDLPPLPPTHPVPGLPTTDPLVNDSFDKIYRRGRAEMNSRLQAVQGRLKIAHSAAAGLVMLLVKASPEVWTCAIPWGAIFVCLCVSSC